MNCKDDLYRSTAIMNADDAIADGRILFILSVILYPSVLGVIE